MFVVCLFFIDQPFKFTTLLSCVAWIIYDLLFIIFSNLVACPPRKIGWCGYRRWCELCPSDAVHAAVQPAGKTAVTEMVCASVWQRKEEDIQRPRPNHTGKEAQDVQLPGMEGPKNCVQEVCKFDSTSNMSWKGLLRYDEMCHKHPKWHWLNLTSALSSGIFVFDSNTFFLLSGLDMPAFISAVL